MDKICKQSSETLELLFLLLLYSYRYVALRQHCATRTKIVYAYGSENIWLAMLYLQNPWDKIPRIYMKSSLSTKQALLFLWTVPWEKKMSLSNNALHMKVNYQTKALHYIYFCPANNKTSFLTENLTSFDFTTQGTFHSHYVTPQIHIHSENMPSLLLISFHTKNKIQYWLLSNLQSFHWRNFMKQLDLGVKHKFILHLEQNTLQIPEHPGFLHRRFFSANSGKWP